MSGSTKVIKSLFGETEGMVSKSLVHLHSYYLTGNIESADEYTAVFETIRNASPNDIIKIHINSYGGDLFTAIQFMRALGESEAQTVASVEGACMSAATMVFLACSGWEVSPHSMFMFHNYSGGTFGKGGEMWDQLVHERKWSENLLRDIYHDFLTEEELTQIIDNKDLWMDGEEVIKRLQTMAEKAKDATEEDDEEEQEVIENPKRKRKKTLDKDS